MFIRAVQHNTELDAFRTEVREFCAREMPAEVRAKQARGQHLERHEYDAWLKRESEKKQGGIDRANSEDIWAHWFRQGVRPTVGGELLKPWNDVKIARQEALKTFQKHE